MFGVSMGLRLVVRSHWTSEPSDELVYEFDQERVVIGRSEGADVCIPHQAVSAKHATVQSKGAGWVVVDAGSTNGTVVNGTKLVPNRPKPLRTGDRVEIGGFALRFEGGIAVAEATTVDRTSALARRIVRELLAPDSGSPDPPRLLVIHGPDEGRELPVPPPPVRLLVGRGEHADLALTDADTSREHFEVERDADGVRLSDLDSKNGVNVNDKPVRARRLRDRDEIRIGATVMVFEDPAQARVHDLATTPDAKVELPGAPEPEPGPEPSPEDAEATVADGGHETDAPPTPKPRARSGASADVIIYLLAAAVLALSIAGLIVLLQSG